MQCIVGPLKIINNCHFFLLVTESTYPVHSGGTPCRSRLCPRSSWPMLVDGTPVGALRMRLLCVHGIPSEKRKPIVTFAQLHPVHAERMRDRTTRGSSIRLGLELPHTLSIIGGDGKSPYCLSLAGRRGTSQLVSTLICK